MATLEHLNYIAKYKNDEVKALVKEISSSLTQDEEGNVCIGKNAFPALKKLVTFNDKFVQTQSAWLLFSLAANFNSTLIENVGWDAILPLFKLNQLASIALVGTLALNDKLQEQVWKNADVLKALVSCLPQEDNRRSGSDKEPAQNIELKQELINAFANIAIAGGAKELVDAVTPATIANFITSSDNAVMMDASTLLQNISLSRDDTAKKLVASKGAVKNLIKAYERLNTMISEDDGTGYNDYMSAQRRTSISIANLLPYYEPGSGVDAIIEQLSVFDWVIGAANDNMPDAQENENDGSFLMLPVAMAFRNLVGNAGLRAKIIDKADSKANANHIDNITNILQLLIDRYSASTPTESDDVDYVAVKEIIREAKAAKDLLSGQDAAKEEDDEPLSPRKSDAAPVDKRKSKRTKKTDGSKDKKSKEKRRKSKSAKVDTPPSSLPPPPPTSIPEAPESTPIPPPEPVQDPPPPTNLPPPTPVEPVVLPPPLDPVSLPPSTDLPAPTAVPELPPTDVSTPPTILPPLITLPAPIVEEPKSDPSPEPSPKLAPVKGPSRSPRVSAEPMTKPSVSPPPSADVPTKSPRAEVPTKSPRVSAEPMSISPPPSTEVPAKSPRVELPPKSPRSEPEQAPVKSPRESPKLEVPRTSVSDEQNSPRTESGPSSTESPSSRKSVEVPPGAPKKAPEGQPKAPLAKSGKMPVGLKKMSPPQPKEGADPSSVKQPVPPGANPKPVAKAPLKTGPGGPPKAGAPPKVEGDPSQAPKKMMVPASPKEGAPVGASGVAPGATPGAAPGVAPGGAPGGTPGAPKKFGPPKEGMPKGVPKEGAPKEGAPKGGPQSLRLSGPPKQPANNNNTEGPQSMVVPKRGTLEGNPKAESPRSPKERTTGVPNLGVNNLQRLPYGTMRTPRAPEEIEKELQLSAQDVSTVTPDTLHALVESITRSLTSIEFEAFNIKFREPFADDAVVSSIAAHFDKALDDKEEALTVSLLRLIANLVSKHSEIQQLFIAKDIHVKLLHLLEERDGAEDTNPLYTSALALAIGSLCANNKPLQEQVCKSKAFAVIAKLVASDDIIVQIEVCQALQNIVHGLDDFQEELVKKYDLLDRLTKILNANTSNRNKEDQNKLLQSVTGLIGATVAGNDKLQRLLRKEIVPKLLAMVDIFKNNNKVVAFVLEALSEACRENSQNQDAVFSLHLVPILVSYLTSSSALLQAKSAELIGLLASKSSRRKENFKQANAIDALQSLTLSTENEQVPMIAQMTLNILQADK